ncbi:MULTISPECIES: alpha/beta hydrolase [unclassified Sphingobacterium]|uniref:alpha/beta hydrolase n=1 Tax=unclassified Sphingobacterium TaxID=2609468 RepID=UPI0025ECA83E|nr:MULTISPECIES: alpha/beta hydrolase [unclassified Sphingobacterium]
MNRYIACLVCLFVVTSCGITHNVPLNQSPNSFEKPNISNSFVDQNGNFYPDNWKKSYGAPPENGKKNDYSLMKIATERGEDDKLRSYETQQLKQVAKRLANKKRVFIFVHGFNSDVRSSNQSYDYIRKQLNVNSSQDEVIRFYWDGLLTNNPFSGAKIWFAATSFSQMAGEFGLRRLLNTMHNKNIYIISHSRGASVVLSALSTPVFKEKFVEEVKDIHHVDIDDASSLKENKNNITCIMLAPAVGLADFRPKDYREGDSTYCIFSEQVKKIHITTNNTDKMLKKVFGFLSDKLEPTDLGYKEDVYNVLCKHYPFFEMTDFSGMESHEFKRYIRNPKFKTMLKEHKIGKN